MAKSKSKRRLSKRRTSRRGSKRLSKRGTSKRKTSKRGSKRGSKRRTSKKGSKSKGKLKLIKIVKSPNKTKKYRAYFNDGTHTDFGAKGYENYGGVGKERHLDEKRKKRYIERHKRNENWKNPKSAGSLSRYILWNKPTFRASVADYKRRFKL